MKLSKQEFLSLAGMGPETLDAWIEAEWLIPSRSSLDLNFSDIDIARARLIRELQVDFGVNDEGVGVILNLVDQLYGMRRTLMELRQAVRPTSEQD
jgi:chaperone modulatory protein CbpM